MGLSTLERDALDGRLEIHVVLDDADTKLTALERPPTATRRRRASNPMKRLRRGDAAHPRRSGHALRSQTDARNSSQARASPITAAFVAEGNCGEPLGGPVPSAAFAGERVV